MLRLKQLRKAAGISVQALANRCNLSRRTIEDIEARGDCRISTAYTICAAMGWSLDDFYSGEVGE